MTGPYNCDSKLKGGMRRTRRTLSHWLPEMNGKHSRGIQVIRRDLAFIDLALVFVLVEVGLHESESFLSA